MLHTLLLTAALLGQPNELNDANYHAWRDLLALKPAETGWLAPGWRTSLWPAAQEAARSERPVLLWATVGHPLGATSATGLAMRRSLWTDPRVRELARSFVPAADDVARLAASLDVEGELFTRAVAEAEPRPFTEGVLATSPGGRVLGATSSTDPRALEAMLEQALAMWEESPGDDRELRLEPGAQLPALAERAPPRDGLALRVVVRDLPRTQGAPADAWNLDFAWFTQSEAASFVPSLLREGQVATVPDTLARRLVRLHLLDRVFGRTPPFEPAEVQAVTLRARISAIEREAITLRIAGSATMSTTAPGVPPRGVDVAMLGRARWDSRLSRFLSFEIVAIGERWGGTAENGRANDLASQPIGFLLSQATATAADQVPPANLRLYGWR
jgi:hypothetical protein